MFFFPLFTFCYCPFCLIIQFTFMFSFCLMLFSSFCTISVVQNKGMCEVFFFLYIYIYKLSTSSHETLFYIPSHPQVSEVFGANTFLRVGLYEMFSCSNPLRSSDLPQFPLTLFLLYINHNQKNLIKF